MVRPTPRGRGGGGSRQRTGNNPSPNVTDVQQSGPTLGTILIDIAGTVFLATEVKKEVAHLEKMRPNPASVRRAAEKWYDAAANTGDSLNLLKGVPISLGVYWDGDGYNAFKDYMDSEVVSTVEKNEEALRAIGDALIEVHNKIGEKYMEGQAKLAATVEKAIQYHKEWGTLEGDAKKSAWNALHDIISLWIAGMITRKAEVRQIANERAGEMVRLKGQVRSLKAPKRMPPGILDKKKWEYDS